MTIYTSSESSISALATDLAVLRACYDAGDFQCIVDRSIALLTEPLNQEDRFKVLLWKSVAESELGRYTEGSETLRLAGLLLDGMSGSNKAKFHGQRALFSSKRKDTDAALVDLAAAKFWAQEAGDKEAEARARNNLAKQYSDAGRVDEALQEVAAAIQFAEGHGDYLLLARFYDLKAGILVTHHRYAEAVSWGEKAVRLLGSHPVAIEARATLGRALISIGGEYLDSDDPLANFRARRSAQDLLATPLTKDLLQQALERSAGNIRTAAASLNLNHSAVRKAMKKHGLTHLQTRRHDRKYFKSVIIVK